MSVRPGNLRAVLFDWDGTLVDSAEASFRCYRRLFASYGIAFGRERFAATYSPDWYRTYEAVALPRRFWSEADSRWVELYAKQKSRLLPGAVDALARFHEAGVVTALVTSGSRIRVERELSAFMLDFDLLVCCEDLGCKKPDPKLLNLTLEQLRVEPSEAAYIGDSPEDVVMSRAAGVYVIGVEGGFPNREALRAARPDLLARNLEHALEALLAPEIRSSP